MSMKSQVLAGVCIKRPYRYILDSTDYKCDVSRSDTEPGSRDPGEVGVCGEIATDATTSLSRDVN